MDHFFIAPSRLGMVHAHLVDLMNMASLAGAKDSPAALQTSLQEQFAASGEGPAKYRVENGTALIPIRGSLSSCQMPGWYWFASQTYESLIATVEAAIADLSVERILLQIHSPGGTVLGCAEAAERLDVLSAQKPLWAHCTMADSAAYWLASAANRIIVDKSGEVGSVGVIMTHADWSKALDSFGIKFTHIFSGAHKADGSPYAPLSPEALARFQEDVDYLRGMFAETVAAYRKTSVETILKTEARTYIGQLAVEATLADESDYLATTLKRFAGETPVSIPPSTQAKELKLGKKPDLLQKAEDEKLKTPAKAAEDKPTDEDKEGEQDEESEPEDAGDENSDKEAAPAEGEMPEDDEDDKECDEASAKARIRSILNCAEAKGREEMAKHVALETSLSVNAARALLAKTPTAAAPAAAENPLTEVMKKIGNPSVGPGGNDVRETGNPLLAAAQKYQSSKLAKTTA